MSSNTKLLVLKSKEILHTLLFIVLGILLLVGFLCLVLPKKKTASSQVMSYTPGVYTSTITLGESTLQVQVTVDEDAINHVALTNATETVTTMYPLLQPALDDINAQIATVSSVEELSFSADHQYTSTLLTQAIKEALSSATSPDSPSE